MRIPFRYVLCIRQRNSCIQSRRTLCNDATEKTEIRVRFAPSPTGHLHLGGLRTALYNYLFAKANNGKFIIRIEDTDQTRLVPGAMDKLFKDLEWVGIIADESVYHGGDYGPYVQSKRLDLYKREVMKLLENGNAYYCFCTERRLELLKKQAVRMREAVGYDNKCRHLTPEQVAEKMAKNMPSCIRFKTQPDIHGLDDMVYGRVEYPVEKRASDSIIIKTDGYPTYHFANIVDDYYMKISHVLRGVEWQISTPKHLQLYRAFGWTPPKFAHLPLLMNSDGHKLSKRQMDINIDYYRLKGIYPQAVINYTIQTGGGFAKRDESESPTSYSMLELQNMFDINLLNTHSGQLVREKLDDCNRLEIHRQIDDPIKCKELIEKLKTLVEKTYPKDTHNTAVEEDQIMNALQWAKSQPFNSLEQMVEGDLMFMWVLPQSDAIEKPIPEDAIDRLTQELENVAFKNAKILLFLKDFAARNNLKYTPFMKFLRGRLSGMPNGPKIGEMMEILGPKYSIWRIRKEWQSDPKRRSSTA